MARALVPGGVIVQVLLMIRLGGPPLPCGRQLGHNLTLPPLLVCQTGDFPCDPLLLLIVIVDGRAVLWAGVGALLVEGCGVVRAIEELEEVEVGYLLGIVDDLSSFGV